MSQILVTGEAKIRDIQGPVVANSGVITALDGAANQYVRGDGTLAIFPSSSGGGSSVSYYLNGSVNQGTFGGSTYYQMSRNAIVGTGTNFSTSSDGLIAQFITDANDPDVVSIPSGNWNVEFFMNVSASSGALASFYVEIYKYNGSTFTLLATNVATPEQLTNTTTVDAYFTSVAMPLSSMAVTDRLAVRIFANVASKTVTLYTEDNRLCQIVTTFSNGLTSLNNLTDQSQYLTTGTSGTDFNIVSSGDTHTFNLPSASASNRGLITTGSQTIAGAKVFDNPITANSGIGFLNGVMPNITSNLYTGIGGNSEGISIITRPFSTNYTNNLYFGLNNNSYTFPDATGTIALTSDLSSYVPYTGATASVNLGAYSLTATGVTANSYNAIGSGVQGGYLYLKQGTTPYAYLLGANGISADGTKFLLISNVDASNNKSALLELGSLTNNTSRTYTLPDITGTLALLEGTQTFSGAKTFANNVKIDNGVDGNYIGFKQYATGSTGTTGFTTLYSISTNGFGIGFGTTKAIQFDSASITTFRTYTFPDASGTVALTSDLSSYVPYTGATTNVDLGTNTLSLNNSFINGNNSLSTGGYLGFKQFSSTSSGLAGYTSIYALSNNKLGINFNQSGGNDKIIQFDATSLTVNAQRVYTLPDASGTLALTSDLSAYLPLTGGTLTGALSGTSATFSGLLTTNGITNGDGTADTRIVTRPNTPFALGVQNSTTSNVYYLGVASSAATANFQIYNTFTAASIFSMTYQGAATFSSSVAVGGGSNSGATFAINNGGAEAKQTFAGFSSNVNLTQSYNNSGAVYVTDEYRAASYIYKIGTSEAMRITSGGNVGIGTSSPDSYNANADNLVVGSSSGANGITIVSSTTDYGSLYFADGTSGSSQYRGWIDYSHNGDVMTFGTSSSERMRITSGGDVLVNSTSTSSGAKFNVFFSDNSHNGQVIRETTGNASVIYQMFNSNGTQTGFISRVGSTAAVLYNTTSDYRLKEDLKEIKGLEKLSKLKVYDFKWIGTNERMDGVIAHELQEVLPYAVNGQKDALDKEGNESYQGVDYSKIVPILVKSIQEQQAQIEELKSLIAAK